MKNNKENHTFANEIAKFPLIRCYTSNPHAKTISRFYSHLRNMSKLNVQLKQNLKSQYKKTNQMKGQGISTDQFHSSTQNNQRLTSLIKLQYLAQQDFQEYNKITTKDNKSKSNSSGRQECLAKIL